MRAGTGTPGEQAMDELEALMCAVATGALPNRAEATAYSRCRDLLMAAPDAVLPGFVHQCLTVFKFRDFITLYDPDPDMRERFTQRAFERCRAIGGEDRVVPLAGTGRSSQRWKF